MENAVALHFSETTLKTMKLMAMDAIKVAALVQVYVKMKLKLFCNNLFQVHSN